MLIDAVRLWYHIKGIEALYNKMTSFYNMKLCKT